MVQNGGGGGDASYSSRVEGLLLSKLFRLKISADSRLRLTAVCALGNGLDLMKSLWEMDALHLRPLFRQLTTRGWRP